MRRQVVRLKEMGKTGKEIEAITGVRQNRPNEIWSEYQQEGEAALEVNNGGCSKGEGRIFLPEKEAEVRETIVSRRPDEFGLSGQLWALKKVCEYVRKMYGKKLSEFAAGGIGRKSPSSRGANGVSVELPGLHLVFHILKRKCDYRDKSTNLKI